MSGVSGNTTRRWSQVPGTRFTNSIARGGVLRAGPFCVILPDCCEAKGALRNPATKNGVCDKEGHDTWDGPQRFNLGKPNVYMLGVSLSSFTFIFRQTQEDILGTQYLSEAQASDRPGVRDCHP